MGVPTPKIANADPSVRGGCTYHRDRRGVLFGFPQRETGNRPVILLTNLGGLPAQGLSAGTSHFWRGRSVSGETKTVVVVVVRWMVVVAVGAACVGRVVAPRAATQHGAASSGEDYTTLGGRAAPFVTSRALHPIAEQGADGAHLAAGMFVLAQGEQLQIVGEA